MTITTHTQLTELASRITEWQQIRPKIRDFKQRYYYKEACQLWENQQDIEEMASALQYATRELDVYQRIVRSYLMSASFRRFGNSSDPEIKKQRFDYIEREELLMHQEALDCIDRLHEQALQHSEGEITAKNGEGL